MIDVLLRRSTSLTHARPPSTKPSVPLPGAVMFGKVGFGAVSLGHKSVFSWLAKRLRGSSMHGMKDCAMHSSCTTHSCFLSLPRVFSITCESVRRVGQSI